VRIQHLERTTYWGSSSQECTLNFKQTTPLRAFFNRGGQRSNSRNSPHGASELHNLFIAILDIEMMRWSTWHISFYFSWSNHHPSLTTLVASDTPYFSWNCHVCCMVLTQPTVFAGLDPGPNNEETRYHRVLWARNTGCWSPIVETWVMVAPPKWYENQLGAPIVPFLGGETYNMRWSQSPHCCCFSQYSWFYCPRCCWRCFHIPSL